MDLPPVRELLRNPVPRDAPPGIRQLLRHGTDGCAAAERRRQPALRVRRRQADVLWPHSRQFRDVGQQVRRRERCLLGDRSERDDAVRSGRRGVGRSGGGAQLRPFGGDRLDDRARQAQAGDASVELAVEHVDHEDAHQGDGDQSAHAQYHYRCGRLRPG